MIITVVPNLHQYNRIWKIQWVNEKSYYNISQSGTRALLCEVYTHVSTMLYIICEWSNKWLYELTHCWNAVNSFEGRLNDLLTRIRIRKSHQIVILPPENHYTNATRILLCRRYICLFRSERKYLILLARNHSYRLV